MFYFLSELPEWLKQSGYAAWADWLSPLRVFQYITFRSAGAAVTAVLLSLWLGPRFIAWLRSVKLQQDYEDRARELGNITGPAVSKKGTPTMGGLLIVGVLDFTALLWAQWNAFIVLTLIAVLVLGALGFYDDYVKTFQQNREGVAEMVKLVVQFALAGFIAVYLWRNPATSKLITDVMVPFVKQPVLTGAVVIGITLAVLAIVGSSNAVNLTDGLDGLAIGCTVIVTVVFLIVTYIAGNVKVAGYLQVPYVPGAGELTVFCAAMIGAGLGFLWFNCHPAQVFMGDTGSLALGGALGIIAVLIHQPLLLVIAGGVFVIEAGSVLIQRGWFKWTKRRTGVGQRVFLMAPLHHHFQKLGWYESQVTTRFYILGILFAVLALGTLKLR
ncbi:MAG: phospho-N-acetylmuramoyl-pentapeptide-transferase [Pedosphaera sp.]|nr:phospho-N-acetylmuramoyl-pentapeptide-transferase [Pedosphaera sp.]MST01378.1 phospho-N-acetylmuramoyl-pentapeptide-transferase [Pedosphaera sp.]